MSDKYVTVEQRVSYGIGRQMGDQLKANPFDGMVIDDVLAGLASALNGEDLAVEPAALDEAFKEISSRMEAKQAALNLPSPADSSSLFL